MIQKIVNRHTILNKQKNKRPIRNRIIFTKNLLDNMVEIYILNLQTYHKHELNRKMVLYKLFFSLSKLIIIKLIMEIEIKITRHFKLTQCV